MSEWRQKGFVQDSDEEEDESQLESQSFKQDVRLSARVARASATIEEHGGQDAIVAATEDAENSTRFLRETPKAHEANSVKHTPARRTSPNRPTPSPFTPWTRPSPQEASLESPDPLQSSPSVNQGLQRPAPSSSPLSTLQQSSFEEIQLRPNADVSSQILGEVANTTSERSKQGKLKTAKVSAILSEFGITAFSDDSEDELNKGQGSDSESILSDYPSDLSDTEPGPKLLFATPHRRTAVQVVIPSSTALQQQAVEDELRRRQFRQRKPIQIHPYVLEGERYRREVQSRGLKPVPRQKSPQPRQAPDNAATQEDEFNPFISYSSSPVDAEIFVSTPADQQTNRSVQLKESTQRRRSDPSKRLSSDLQLRVPKSTKRRKLNRPSVPILATPARTAEGSPMPRDIWSVPPNSPPYSSSPPLQAPSSKPLPTGNTDSLPTPSNSSIFQDERQPLMDSDSEPVPRSIQRSGGQLRQPTRIILSDDPSSDSDATSSEPEQAEGELQKVSKTIRGVLPASWLRIDQQAQERRQALARQRARAEATLPPPPAEPQRGVAQRIVRPFTRPVGLARPTEAVPAGVVVISDGSDDDVESVVHRQVQDVQGSTEDASSLAAIFDDRYAASDDDLASMEHDRLQLHTLGGAGVRRKRQPKITDAFGNKKRTKITKGPERNRFPKPKNGSAGQHRQAGLKKSRRTPPALSVMDIELPSNAPQFLKLARRAARRDVNLARQSPRRKQIRLHTAQDTEDANVALRQWQQGHLKPNDEPNVGQQEYARPPLADTTDNRQHGLHLNDVEKPANRDTDTNLVPRRLHSSRSARKAVAPALKLLRRNPALTSHTARRKKAAAPVNRHGKDYSRNPLPFRAAQLEDNEKDFGRSNRKIAFQKGLQRVDQQSGVQQSSRESSLNPQLARFLAEEDDVLPPQPLTEDNRELNDNGSAELSANKITPILRKRLVRKHQAERLDVDARKYRQPSEPTFEAAIVVPALVSTASASVGQQGDVLHGLGSFGTKYPITFDITPFKSDTYFNSRTFIGSEELRRALSVSKNNARNLDEHAGYCTISHGSTKIRCGPWNDETFSRIQETLKSIWTPLNESHDQTVLANVLESVATVLRSLSSYIADHLSFLDPIDRTDFIAKIQHLLHALLDRASTAHLMACEKQLLSEPVQSMDRLLSYLLVVSAQVWQVAQGSLKSLDKARLPDLMKDTSRLLIRNITGRTQDLYDFHDKNKFHKERENGIQDTDVLIESVVICMHVLELVNIPSTSFWDLVGNEFSSRIHSAAPVQTIENIWATLFSLLPFVDFDLSGIPDRSRTLSFREDSWGCISDLLRRVFDSYLSTFKKEGSLINDYIRVNLSRCYVLINDWHWKRPEQVLNIIFDFFGKHGLKPLLRETATGSAMFLQNFLAADSLALESNESSFHIALKCLVTGLHGMNDAYPEKKLRSFVFRRIPNHGRIYPKDQPLEQESLAALRNNHDVVSALYCAALPSCRPKLHHICGLVSHESSHREACRVSVRAWANLTAFQLSMNEPYEAAQPFALWYKEIMYQTLKQYRLAKTEAEDYLNSGVLDGTTEVSAMMVRQTMERNQEQVIATLRDSITGMTRAVECAKAQTSLETFLTDSDIVHLLELPHLEDRRLLDVIRDTLVVFRQYASLQRHQAEEHVSQPRSEESQDYGDFPDLDDLDESGELQSTQNKATSLSSRLDFIQGPLWHLMSNAFGAEQSPDDNLLMDCIDTWVLVASDQVTAGGKQWSHYMDSFSPVSWQQLRHTEQTRKFGPYFMAALIISDPIAYREHQQEFLTSLLLCLADRESMLKFQHRLLDAIVRIDDDHPMLRNLPFFRAQDNTLDVTAETLRARRLALISSLLSNMRDDVYATAVQEPNRTAEVKRTYAAMLKEFMARLKSNYQQLQQGTAVTGAYVEFVQKIVQFLKHYTGEICPVLPFFTDSVAFPLPSTDPTYVVGRLGGYAAKARDPGTAKQLSIFIQTVAQQTAADGQEVYLVNQLTTALCTDETPIADRVALRAVLLQDIFPAYIEEAFSSRTSYLIARPIMRCLPAVLDEMVFDLRVSDPSSLASSIQILVSVAHAFIRGTEMLKGDNPLFQQSSILGGLVYMFEAAVSISRLMDYIVGRTATSISHAKLPLIAYLEEFRVYVNHMVEGIPTSDLPSYRGDANVEGADLNHAGLLAFCKRGLKTSLETNWSEHEGSIWFGQGQARKEVIVDSESVGDERSRLMGVLRKFQNTLIRPCSDEPPVYEDFVDGFVV